MSALNAGMTRDAAFELLSAHNHDPFHIEHAETVEQTMRYFAREYDPENEEFWGIVGLLHDLDWEKHDDEPAMHTLYATPLIEEAGGAPEFIRAIQSHTSDYNTDLPKPELMMEKILFATEDLTGLIGAAVIMRPSKSVMDFNVKSLKKKFKDKRFAAGVSRDVIRQGAEMLGWELDEVFARTIEAMQSFAPTATPLVRTRTSGPPSYIDRLSRFDSAFESAFSPVVTYLPRTTSGLFGGRGGKDHGLLPAAARHPGSHRPAETATGIDPHGHEYMQVRTYGR